MCRYFWNFCALLREAYEESSAPLENLPISKPPRILLVSKKLLENKVGESV